VPPLTRAAPGASGAQTVSHSRREMPISCVNTFRICFSCGSGWKSRHSGYASRGCLPAAPSVRWSRPGIIPPFRYSNVIKSPTNKGFQWAVCFCGVSICRTEMSLSPARLPGKPAAGDARYVASPPLPLGGKPKKQKARRVAGLPDSCWQTAALLPGLVTRRLRRDGRYGAGLAGFGQRGLQRDLQHLVHGFDEVQLHLLA